MNKLRFDLIISVLIVMAGFYLMMLQITPRLDNYLKAQALYQCGQIAKVSYTTAEGSTISHPYQPEYESCLKAKGY